MSFCSQLTSENCQSINHHHRGWFNLYIDKRVIWLEEGKTSLLITEQELEHVIFAEI